MKLNELNLAEVLSKIKHLSEPEQVELLKLVERLEQAKARENARTSFLGFVKETWPGFIHGRHHEIMAEAFERVVFGKSKRLIINMPPRHRLNVQTPIATISGWKTVETVQVGDYVFAPDGKPVLVTGKSDEYEEDLYEVITSDGQVIECDGEHLWTLRFGSGKPFITISTKEILEKLETGSWRINGNMPALPAYNAAEYLEATLPIDPYVLGVWLGNGNSWSGLIGCSYADMDWMRGQFEKAGYQTTFNPKFQQFNALGLITDLKNNGLIRNKHIPEQYLSASIEQRIALLQGLIDTDGDVTKEGKVTFNQSSKSLIDQVLCLIHSLGIKARVTERQGFYEGVPVKTAYRIMFKFARAARMPRKAERCRDMQGNFARTIDVRKTNRRGRVRCLEVANEDGLFMAGRGWVVTHNTKSEFASYLLPAWFMGNFPDKKIIQATHTAELAVNFGRRVRNLLNSEDFAAIFPDVELQADSKASGRWSTNKGGEYFAVGVGGAIAGKGADLFIIDDPHTEQEAILAAHDPSIYDKVFDWYTSGPRQRLQPEARIVLVQTRWGQRDLTGRLIKSSMERNDGDTEWEVIELPAILPSGSPLWPQFWKIEALEALKAELPAHKWNAQYQQSPTNAEGAILKRDWWKRWDSSRPPGCEYIIVSADTAFTKNNRSDYTAFTVWGIFSHPDDNGMETQNLILLDAWKDRLEFPELKQRAMEMYKEWEPDTLMIEGKASGLPLIHELRQLGIPVSEFTPTRASGDKIMRANSVSDMFASGIVWAPETRWADEVIEECASFPNGAHDDYVDTVIMALMRYRQGGFIRLPSDYDDEADVPRRAEYY